MKEPIINKVVYADEERNIHIMHPVAVIILGGSGFIGRELCQHWPAELDGTTTVRGGVYAVNRGRTHWGAPVDAPHVTQVIGDRTDAASMRRAFVAVVARARDRVAHLPAAASGGAGAPNADAALVDSKKQLDLIVVDFSSATDKCIENTHAALEHCKDEQGTHLLHYILISTDSVYADLDDSRLGALTSPEWRITEQYPLREPKPGRAGRNYADHKRRIEPAAIAAFGAKHVTALRMADVLGEYDDTSRFWATLLWAECVAADHSHAPRMRLDADVASRYVSFTLSSDVCDLLWRMIGRLSVSSVVDGDGHDHGHGQGHGHGDAPQPHLPPITGGCFNIACRDPLPMCEFVSHIFHFAMAQKDRQEQELLHQQHNELVAHPGQLQRRLSGIPGGAAVDAAATSVLPHVSESSSSHSSGGSGSGSGSSDTDSSMGDEATCDYYPSVRCGAISSDAAVTQLGWAPTPVLAAVDRACRFFSGRRLRGLSEFGCALKKLPKGIASKYFS